MYEIHFEVTPADREAAFQELFASNPQHAAHLRDRVAALGRSEDLLGRVRQEIELPDGSERIGPFVVLRVLGEGGFGTVFLAEQREPVRRPVALKVLQGRRLDDRSRRRFEDERQVLARLQHACIAQVFDAGVTATGLDYFAMEYVDGEPITAWCERRRLDTTARLRLFLQVCGAIHHAHQRGVVHRDIKPSNVLVRDEAGVARPKVIDFGIAKLLAGDDGAGDAPGRTLTRQGGQVGTPGYMSPEQAAGEPVDTRSDVYALGVLLCELLTGELPYPRTDLRTSSFVALARLLAEQPPNRPSRLLRESDDRRVGRLDPDLDWIVLAALAARPDDRYTSVAALAEDVERCLRHEPVFARRNATGYVIGKFVQRHRVGVAFAGVLAAALIVGVVGLLWGTQVLDAARARAERERDAARIAAAQLSILSGDVPTAHDYLESVAPERRGWEWRHLAAQRDHARATVALENDYHDVVWLDDRRVLLLPLRGDPEVRDTGTGERELTFTDWPGSFRRVALLPDRRSIVVAADRGIFLWDVETGRQLRRVHGVAGEPHGLGLAPDARRVALVGRGAWLHVLDLDRSGLVHDIALERDAHSVTFVSADEVVAGLANGDLVRIALPTGEVVDRFAGHTDNVDDLLHDPFADRLYSAAIDGTVRVWDLGSRAIAAVLPVHVRVRRLALSPDRGTLYAAGGYTEGKVVAWETATFGLLGCFHGHTRGVRGVALSPNGSALATASRDLTLRVWDAEPPVGKRRFDAGIDARFLTTDAGGTRFATAAIDGTVRVWSASTLELELDARLAATFTGCVLGAERIYVACGNVGAISIPDRAVVARGETGGTRLEKLALDPAERWLVGGHGSRFLVIALPELAVLHELELPVGGARGVWDERRSAFAISCPDATVRWLDPSSGQIIDELRLADSTHLANGLDFHADLMAVGHGRTVTLCGRDGTRRREIHAFASGCAFSPDGRRLAIGGADHKVRVLDPETAVQLLVIPDLPYNVADVRFVAGGRRLVALSHRWEAPSYVHVFDAPPLAGLGR